MHYWSKCTAAKPESRSNSRVVLYQNDYLCMCATLNIGYAYSRCNVLDRQLLIIP